MNKSGRMRTSDLLHQSWAAMGANTLRSGLTVLGVAIGVFSVVAVMTALSALRESINTSLNVLGVNVFQISRESPFAFTEGGRQRWWERPQITPRQALDFKARMDAEGIPVAVLSADQGERVSYRDRKTSPRVRVVGTNEYFLLTNKYEIATGRNISAADIEFNRPVVILGSTVAEELFPRENPIGRDIISDGAKYTVIGVLDERGTLFGQSMDDIVLVPITRWVANNWRPWRSMEMSVQAPSDVLMEATQELAITHLRAVRSLEPEEENDFDIFSNETAQRIFAEVAFYVGTGGLLISAIALVCSGIGIMNIMLVSVTERIREIGVRMSLGARRRDILRQFLSEALFLSESGAVLGIVFGVAVGNIVATQLGVSMIFPWDWVLIAVGVCSVIGVGFGFLPALRASRLHPVEALRHE